MGSAISITELRQRLFRLADQVIETGEPLVIERRGVRLKLVREDAASPEGGRLSRLVRQEIVVGPPLDPHESPSEWSGAPDRGEPMPKLAGSAPQDAPKPQQAARPRRPQ